MGDKEKKKLTIGSQSELGSPSLWVDLRRLGFEDEEEDLMRRRMVLKGEREGWNGGLGGVVSKGRGG